MIRLVSSRIISKAFCKGGFSLHMQSSQELRILLRSSLPFAEREGMLYKVLGSLPHFSKWPTDLSSFLEDPIEDLRGLF